MKRFLLWLAVALAVMLAWHHTQAVTASEFIPHYEVTLMGPGYPKALNNAGEATGWVNDGGIKRAWVYRPGAGYTYLPLPPGTQHATAYDINDNGDVVGSAASGFYDNGEAVIWQRTAEGYSAQLLGTLPGHNESVATALNNVGDVVGYSVYPGYSGGPAVLFTAPGGIQDLSQLGFSATPRAINDARQLVGGRLRLDLDVGTVEDLGLPAGIFSYNLVYSYGINESGQVAGTGVVATSTDANQTMIRYTDGGGWQELSGPGRYTNAYDINAGGDVAGEHVMYCGSGTTAIFTPVVYLEGFGLHCINDLLAEADSNWFTFTSFDAAINDGGQIAVVGQTGSGDQAGALLLTPAGAVPPPAAPSNLVATPHEATWQQPWNAIELSWTDNSSIETGFRVERREAGQSAWTPIANVSSDGGFYRDMDVALATTYEYRVFATGFGGDSTPSNIATATAPSAPVDTEAPAVTISSPADGAQVEGNVQIVVEATDNAGLNFVDASVEPNNGTSQICSAGPGGSSSYTLTCNWQTQELAPGSYTLTAYASDLMGNYATSSIVVEVAGASATVRVDGIALSAKTRRGTTTVTGDVSVIDQNGDAVRGALVSATWTLPDGSTSAATAYTNRKGEATFSASDGSGDYTLTVGNVTLAGYTFDAANSTLTATLSTR